MKHLFPALLLATTSLFSLPSCQTAPPIGYENQPEVVVERHKLKDELLLLLPEAQRTLPEAVKEAQLLADTSYTAAAAIGRINQPRRWPAWRNNKLVLWTAVSAGTTNMICTVSCAASTCNSLP